MVENDVIIVAVVRRPNVPFPIWHLSGVIHEPGVMTVCYGKS